MISLTNHQALEFSACVHDNILKQQIPDQLVNAHFLQVHGKPATLCVSLMVYVTKQSLFQPPILSHTFGTAACLLARETVEVVGVEDASLEATSCHGSFHPMVT